MKRIVVCVLLAVFLSTAGYAAFPPVPADVTPYRVKSYDGETDVYIWSENGHIYVRLVPITAGAFWLGDDFKPVIQDGKQYDSFQLYKEDGGHFATDLFVPYTLELACYSTPCFDANRTLTVILDTSPPTYIDLTPRTPQPIYPTNGIWKSADGVLAMYLQKYKAGSCVLVVTMGDQNYTAFLDSNYKDGISASNDVDNQGYTLNLQLTDSEHGTLTVTLPGFGEVVTGVECKFEDEK